jgi:ABC-type Mn2+/Zn2+ transport system permease subunit
MQYASDHALAATVAGILAALWFAWTVRHSGPWTRLLPVAGVVAACGVVAIAVVAAVRSWPDGTVVTGRVVAIYVAALLAHGVLTRLCTGLIASRYRQAVAAAKDEDKAAVTAGKPRLHLIPTVVALSTAIQVAIVANTLDVPFLYLGSAAGILAALAAWPLAWVLRTATRPRGPRSTAALAHPLTGLLTGAVLTVTAVWVLLPPP